MKGVFKEFLWKARVRNYSSKTLWIVETTTQKKGFQAVAHRLRPGMKSPSDIDADGFRRYDDGLIEGHKAWWKMGDHFQAYIYGSKNVIRAVVLPYKKKASITQFGDKVFYDKSTEWGEKITNIVDIKRNHKREIKFFLLEGMGWVKKERAIQLASKGEIDNVVIVKGKNGVYLRSRPDGRKSNNFSNMG